MASVLSSRRVVKTMSGGDEAQRSAAPVKQLLRKLQYRLRSAARPRRGAPVSFVYDLHSYSQNFDDGLGSDHHL
ncbi:hypothetical protein PR202_ga00463 [Eleusine coracana subsp. coracana]|uniref:Uncharacterized protein n=1 Tax=Eleusine coracana subsp. coracana TaxID=191504 RepID=A0AAV5BFI3_ELECO|nr:hypothetical protein QOZ80_2AG0127380 [Eleusine coracana subsp. coracana]GJM84761.1 hypothetical protein PR202_ga00463 [Eleusine coracana subsp. coracana]